MFAALQALIIGMTVLESLGAMMTPSTLRLMKFFTCSNCLLASPSATASSMEMPCFMHSSLMRSHAATQPSVCNVSKATPMVFTCPDIPTALDDDCAAPSESDLLHPDNATAQIAVNVAARSGRRFRFVECMRCQVVTF